MRIESGQVAVVTGAASGIGRAIATELVGRGVSVALADVHEEGVRSLADELATNGVELLPAAVDVTDAEKMHTLAQRVLDHFGRIDLVFNNAGIAPLEGAPLWETDLVSCAGNPIKI